MLFDPRSCLEPPGLVLAGTGRRPDRQAAGGARSSCVVLRYPSRSRSPVAVALAQIGEFSFILADLGRQLGVLSVAAVNAGGGRGDRVDLVNAALPSGEALRTMGPACAVLWRLLDPGMPVPHDGARHRTDASHRAVVVGYGPAGRLSRLLRENDIEPTVIELNLETVRALREEASRPSTATRASATRSRPPGSPRRPASS